MKDSEQQGWIHTLEGECMSVLCVCTCIWCGRGDSLEDPFIGRSVVSKW